MENKNIAQIRKILRLNEYVLIAVVVINFLLYFLFLFGIGTEHKFDLVNSYLVDGISTWSKFPVLTNNSMEISLLISAVMFFINLPVCFYLVGIFIKDRQNEIFEQLKSSHKLLLELGGFQSIYPDIFYKPVLMGKGILFKLMCLFGYLAILFMALEWYVWFDILLMPKWLGYSISNIAFCLILWNIVSFVIISFMCSSFASFLLIIIYSMFRKDI